MRFLLLYFFLAIIGAAVTSATQPAVRSLIPIVPETVKELQKIHDEMFSVLLNERPDKYHNAHFLITFKIAIEALHKNVFTMAHMTCFLLMSVLQNFAKVLQDDGSVIRISSIADDRNLGCESDDFFRELITTTLLYKKTIETAEMDPIYKDWASRLLTIHVTIRNLAKSCRQNFSFDETLDLENSFNFALGYSQFLLQHSELKLEINEYYEEVLTIVRHLVALHDSGFDSEYLASNINPFSDKNNCLLSSYLSTDEEFNGHFPYYAAQYYSYSLLNLGPKIIDSNHELHQKLSPREYVKMLKKSITTMEMKRTLFFECVQVLYDLVMESQDCSQMNTQKNIIMALVMYACYLYETGSDWEEWSRYALPNCKAAINLVFEILLGSSKDRPVKIVQKFLQCHKPINNLEEFQSKDIEIIIRQMTDSIDKEADQSTKIMLYQLVSFSCVLHAFTDDYLEQGIELEQSPTYLEVFQKPLLCLFKRKYHLNHLPVQDYPMAILKEFKSAHSALGLPALKNEFVYAGLTQKEEIEILAAQIEGPGKRSKKKNKNKNHEKNKPTATSFHDAESIENGMEIDEEFAFGNASGLPEIPNSLSKNSDSEISEADDCEEHSDSIADEFVEPTSIQVSVPPSHIQALIDIEDRHLTESIDPRDLAYSYLIIGNEIQDKYLNPFIDSLEQQKHSVRSIFNESLQKFQSQIQLLNEIHPAAIKNAFDDSKITSLEFFMGCIKFYEKRLKIAHPHLPSGDHFRRWLLRMYTSQLHSTTHSKYGEGLKLMEKSITLNSIKEYAVLKPIKRADDFPRTIVLASNVDFELAILGLYVLAPGSGLKEIRNSIAHSRLKLHALKALIEHIFAESPHLTFLREAFRN